MNHHTPPTRIRAHARQAGFSLMEVLVAMGIFLVGIVAVATVFPTAIAVQRETIDDMNSQAIIVNAQSTMQALGLSGIDEDDPLTYKMEPDPSTPDRGTLVPYAEDSSDHPAVGTMQMIVRYAGGAAPVADAYGTETTETPNLATGSPKIIADALPLETRSFPAMVFPVRDRDYFWVPMVQFGSPSSDNNTSGVSSGGWSCAVFILRRRGTNAPPQIRYAEAEADDPPPSGPSSPSSLGTTFTLKAGGLNNDPDGDGTPDFIQPGDDVLASNGEIHHVILVDGNKIRTDSAFSGDPVVRLYFGVNVNDAGEPIPGGASPTLGIKSVNMPVQAPNN